MNHATHTEQVFQTAIAAAGMTPPDPSLATAKSSGSQPTVSAVMAAGTFSTWTAHPQVVGNSREGRTRIMVQYRAQRADRRAAKGICHTNAGHHAGAVQGQSGRARHSGANGCGNLGSGNTDRRCRAAWLPCKKRHPAPRRTTDRHAGGADALPRLSGVLDGPLLVVPMRNAAGELRSLQFITEGGEKGHSPAAKKEDPLPDSRA